MKLIEVVKECFKKSFTFDGRACRSEFWYFSLFSICVYIVLGLISDYFLNSFEDVGSRNLINYSYTFLSSILTFPFFSVTTRRLHDVNRSGWWQLTFLTVVGILLIYYWSAKSSYPSNNKYGELTHQPDEGKRITAIALVLQSIILIVYSVFIAMGVTQSFDMASGWIYSEEIDQETKISYVIASHLTQDKVNGNVFVYFNLYCSEKKDLYLGIATFDNPQKTLAKPDSQYPAIILKDGPHFRARGIFKDSGSDAEFLFHDASNKNEISTYINKYKADKLLAGSGVNFYIDTDRGPLSIFLNPNDSNFQKVLNHCSKFN